MKIKSNRPDRAYWRGLLLQSYWQTKTPAPPVHKSAKSPKAGRQAALTYHARCVMIAQRAGLLVVLLVLAGCQTWTRRDTIEAGAFVATMTLDAIQTRNIMRDGRESNVVEGPHGERVSMYVYIPIFTAVGVLLPQVLPEGWRDGVRGLFLGEEVDCVVSNAGTGYYPGGSKWDPPPPPTGALVRQ